MKAKVIELQDLNRKLSAEVDNASNRSVVMEVMAKEALDESKRYEDQKLSFQMLEKDLENACQMLEKDLENAFVYILKQPGATHFLWSNAQWRAQWPVNLLRTCTLS